MTQQAGDAPGVLAALVRASEFLVLASTTLDCAGAASIAAPEIDMALCLVRQQIQIEHLRSA